MDLAALHNEAGGLVLNLGHLESEHFALAAVPAVTYRRDAVVEVLLAEFKNSVHLYSTFRVDLPLMGQWDLDVGNKAHSNAHCFLADDCI